MTLEDKSWRRGATSEITFIAPIRRGMVTDPDHAGLSYSDRLKRVLEAFNDRENEYDGRLPVPLALRAFRGIHFAHLVLLDYLYRKYNGSAELALTASAGTPHAVIKPQDTVISWIGGAAQPGDGPSGEVRFGAGAHMCPGREMARAIIDGTLTALSGCKTLVLSDARASKLELTL